MSRKDYDLVEIGGRYKKIDPTMPTSVVALSAQGKVVFECSRVSKPFSLGNDSFLVYSSSVSQRITNSY